MAYRILIIEDDPGVRESLALGLGLEGYQILEAPDGKAGLGALQQNPDLVLLDALLPDQDGFSVLRQIRTHHTVPVLMLTALDEVNYRVKGLKEGADDYLVKPFALAELLARIEALLRRALTTNSSQLYQGLQIFPDKMEARRDGEILELSPKAFWLLKTFLDSPEEVLSKEELMLRVWGSEVEPNTLEVHLSSLRRALGDPPLIHTVRGYGYVLRKHEPA